LFNNAQFSVFLLEGQRFVDANRTAVQMFGLESERSAVGLTPWDLSPQRQPGGQQSEELARAKIETALHEGGTTFEWLHKRADTGETFPAEVDLSSLSTGGTVLALAVVHDVTVRKRAEHDLQVLSAELMRLQDEERRRLDRPDARRPGTRPCTADASDGFGRRRAAGAARAVLPSCNSVLGRD
jgi:PAS domain S-box-containing protein